jgi:hypothetical protein
MVCRLMAAESNRGGGSMRVRLSDKTGNNEGNLGVPVSHRSFDLLGKYNQPSVGDSATAQELMTRSPARRSHRKEKLNSVEKKMSRRGNSMLPESGN